MGRKICLASAQPGVTGQITPFTQLPEATVRKQPSIKVLINCCGRRDRSEHGLVKDNRTDNAG